MIALLPVPSALASALTDSTVPLHVLASASPGDLEPPLRHA
ncbi:hypothetical protein [Nonomuraea turkmeniaca]|nr:hypothetical protein [Nonomuraea turkmeniaca]